MSSTDNTPVEPTTTPVPTPTPATGSTSAEPAPAVGTDTAPTTEQATAGQPTAETAGAPAEPGWVTRHTALLTALMVAVIVAALAVAGVFWYRSSQDDENADTEAAFSRSVTEQGATVETVECDGDTCSAVIGGQAYTVLVQEDSKGEQHFGVTAYVGD